MKKIISLLLTLTLLLTVTSCHTSQKVAQGTDTSVTRTRSGNDSKHEFRGAWVQTAWQDRYMNKTPEKCRQYLDQLIETLSQSGFNAVLFQVRPEGDAFYDSQYEPWSRFLTGRQGKAPSPAWDPMAYLIQLCHNHGMEFHAWINPYRMFSSKNLALASGHLYYRHPEYFVTFDDKLYLNPGLPESRSWIREVVKDIVSRYDVDAIHMDDYFYPYPVADKEFNDLRAFQVYGPQFGFTNTTSRAELGKFRRHCVDILIKSVGQDIKSLKPWVRFGVSPFGIYRNKKTWAGGSDTNGTQCYDDLYADVLRWANDGWIDYVIPQLYWEIGHKSADYTTLCNWWAKNITSNCHLYIGQSIERSLDNGNNLLSSHSHFDKKLKLSSQKGVDGNCFWYAYEIEDNQFGVRDYLQQRVFTTRALPTAYTELNKKPMGKASGLDGTLVRTQAGQVGIRLTWKAPAAMAGNGVRFYNVYRFKKGESVNTSSLRHIYRQVASTELYDFDIKGSTKYTYVITPVDYYNNEGKAIRKSFKLNLH